MVADDNEHVRVLVCVVTQPADLERARSEGWYRIPQARAPRGMAANYLAFYQTAAFGDERWAIRWFAPVRAVTLVRRVDLLPEDLAHRRALEQYYRFALAPLELLPTPIPSRRLRRISFIATTLAQLQQARDVVELWDAPECTIHGVLWGAGIGRRSLKR
jgi:hypothetical protein